MFKGGGSHEAHEGTRTDRLRKVMEVPQTTSAPAMRTGMLIRRPPSAVFAAFIDPAITTQFWFTHGTGRLEPGKQVEWRWEMYNVSAPVTVKAIEPDTRIVIEWPGEGGARTVEWTFTPHGDGTFVRITETGFNGEPASLIRQIADSTQGFTLVLAGAKAWLEHGLRLNLVGDRYPAGLEAH